jgi:hypothetical protein
MTISNLTAANVYTVQLIAENAAGNTQPSAPATGKPYIIGSAPVVSNVVSIPYGVSVSFTGTTDGNPDPDTYYYSVDGGITYLNGNTTTSPLSIRGLDQFVSYPITVKAHNLLGNTAASEVVYGTPYILGSTPVISTIISIKEGLSITFSASEGGNPPPSSYLYSVDGGATFVDSGSVVSPIVASGLTASTKYRVVVQANSLAGNTASSNMAEVVYLYDYKLPTTKAELTGVGAMPLKDINSESGGSFAVARRLFQNIQAVNNVQTLQQTFQKRWIGGGRRSNGSDVVFTRRVNAMAASLNPSGGLIKQFSTPRNAENVALNRVRHGKR